jgi:hypothetical protein
MIVAFGLIGTAAAHPVRGYALPVLSSVLGAVLGFLYYNLRRRSRRRASVFLGDAGSLVLGFVLGWFAVGLTVAPGTVDMPPAAVLWLLWVPLYDTCGVMIRRIMAGRSPLSPDREHLHHLFQDLGYSPRQTGNRLIALNFLGGAIGVGGVDRFTSLFQPLTFEAIRVPSPGGPCPATGSPPPSLADALAAVERVFTAHAGTIAALVMEPLVQMAAGIYVHPLGFLRGVADLCQKHDVLLILDEVATGFGRTGTMFACEQEGVSPDFLCLAKGLTAGYIPMAATLTTPRVWNAFLGTHADQRTFFHGHTYGGNPLAAAVGLESLAIFRDDRVLDALPPKIARLREHGERLARLDHVGAVRQCGLVLGLDLVADKATGLGYPWQERRGTRACLAARKHGALLRQLGDTVVVMPPLAITLDELDLLMAATERGIRDTTMPQEA